MEISNDLLNGVPFEESPNHGDVFAPDTIIIHYTAGPSARSAINTFIEPEKKVSAHVVIDTDGSLTQMVPFNMVAWHAGKSRHLDRKGLNKYSIGIEVVNAGRLNRSGSVFVSWFGREYGMDKVMKAVHRNEDVSTFWHRYSEEQISSVSDLCSTLVNHYNLKFILGHEEVSPGRKIDPGPAFPLDKLRNRILQLDAREADDDLEEYEIEQEGLVTPTKLNIRSGPSSARAKIANPLTQGKKVKILGKKNGWLRVSATIEGWVASQYIQKV
jgi:N-acetylmuramoyl-L-alanine amidase